MTEGFTAFWAAWPANTQTYSRKGAKGECLKKWHSLGCEVQAAHIVAHVGWLKTTADWQKNGGEYIPAPLVYLNQQRWDGADIPQPAVPYEQSDLYQQRLKASIAKVDPKVAAVALQAIRRVA